MEKKWPRTEVEGRDGKGRRRAGKTGEKGKKKGIERKWQRKGGKMKYREGKGREGDRRKRNGERW